MSEVDWTKPIEACHVDGRVVPVTVDGNPDGAGDYYTFPNVRDMPCVWRPSGRSWVGDKSRLRGWRIRNTSQNAEGSQDAKGLISSETLPSNEIAKRMEALVRRIAADWTYMSDGRSFSAEARAIVALLPEPVDSDEAEAERIAYDLDGGLPRDLALAAIKRGRELERGA